METSGIILVAGATGGVGRRVVDILRSRGLPVKALVRNEEKARKMLGPDIDLIVADITKENTLVPEKFKGVRKVINAVSVIVGPKEGDTPERQKYNQGVRFFEPEIKGDSPELVEYVGMKNLINAVKDGVGLENGKLIFGVGDNTFKDLPWGALDDVVMGGVSESNFIVDLTGGENGVPTGIFKGNVSTTNNGGFTSVRTKNFSEAEDLSAYDGLELRLKGDGLRYKLIVRTSQDWDTVGYTASFDTSPGQWQSFVSSVFEKLTNGSTTEETVNEMETSGIILVAGATGGVGRRVVDILRSRGLPVKALVRNEEKARKMLGPDIDLIVADITKENTLVPEKFKGVRKVINAVSVIVGPKEGDTPERQKYNQGVRFFEPEIKGDSPELVEYVGMKNLINAVKDGVGLENGKLIFGVGDNTFKDLPWGALDDVVMGGVSESNFIVDLTGGENGGPTGIFKGNVSTTNNGGFTSVRTKNFPEAEDLSAYDGLELRLKGDGLRYKLIVRTSQDWDTVGYTASFDTSPGQWQSVRLPFSSLRPVFRARTKSDAPPFNPASIISLQLMFSKFEYDGKLNPTFKEGPFELPLSTIRAYIQDPVTPRFVHVGSAGVTRPERPGLDLSTQPPAVRLNKELDFILTYKLKGEDLIRESGIPYAIVRPCALTEEPAGADLIFDQGDNITGKVSRDEVARICIAALESPHALNKTFEVKSTFPFSEPFTVDPENPPPEKDYNEYFKNLKDGITGKEALEQSTVSV
ncbi:hypothetical protein F2Q70_00034588 [Brassica cretica]|uniref:NADH:ubiquinone oxidoreductase intermediate-associated protein 30 domain-containing protein n=1 Tax=Brassica cretica TaxID=69181 RepID=A0A8S9JTT5_BRACR|nr:hypothetical protein F2Q70_00034588 [Brassica cretica]